MDRPIEVRGTVDQRAVEQLQRCADAGDAMAAAICADGHVGYSQAIGGVVAYRDYAIPCPDHPNARLIKRWLTERIRVGVIDWPAVLSDLDTKQIELRGGAADEAPGAYKRLDEVLEAHADTIRIKHRLTPIGVAMAGPDVYDPFKD